MCGRYLFKMDEDVQLSDWLEKIPTEQHKQLSLREVFPSQKTLVFTKYLTPTVMSWGLQKFKGSGRVINARIEGVQSSPFFKNHLLHRRIIVQADAFYEWDKDKQRHIIMRQDQSPLFMAGLYDEANNFAIMTTEATGDFRSLHTRVPVILTTQTMNAYLDQGLSSLNTDDLNPSNILRWENLSPQVQLF
jgi:putative SOS response-associated peptidase YedK